MALAVEGHHGWSHSAQFGRFPYKAFRVSVSILVKDLFGRITNQIWPQGLSFVHWYSGLLDYGGNRDPNDFGNIFLNFLINLTYWKKYDLYNNSGQTMY